jgi:hypothetical protein
MLSLAAHFPAVGAHRAPALALEGLRRGGAGGAALAYIAASHMASAAAVAASLAPWWGFIARIHFAYMGFIGVHILLHAPLMMPQILGVRLAKAYYPAPPALMSAAAIARPLEPSLSFALAAAAIAAAALQFRPQPPARRRGRPAQPRANG